MKLARIKKAAMDGMPPTAVFCVIGSVVATAKTVIRGIFDGGMTMSEYFAGGHLRFVDGEWRDNDGNAIEIYRVRHGRWGIDGVYVVCSVCNRFTLSPIVKQLPTFKYCPNCGAKMDGGVDNSDNV